MISKIKASIMSMIMGLTSIVFGMVPGRSMNRADLQRVIYLLERDTVVKVIVLL